MNVTPSNIFEEAKLRADIIDGAVRLAMVSKLKDGEKYDRNQNPVFDKFDIRIAIAVALEMYHTRDAKAIAMMNKLTSK